MDRHPLIETWLWKAPRPGGKRPEVTSEHATVFEARKARAVKLGLHPTQVMGRRLGA
jgi:hypothetical protein